MEGRWHDTVSRGQFVHRNRHNKTREQIHSYDIVYGPVANDDIGMQMRRIDADLITWEQFVRNWNTRAARRSSISLERKSR